VHTPMRYAWNMYDEYFGRNRNWIIPFFIHYLRMWDVASSHRVDHFICNSHNVEKRIKKFYRREAEVIYPPVDSKRFKVHDQKEKTAGSIPTGLFFHEANGASLVDAIERFVTIEKEFDPLAIRNHTLKWDREIFKEKMKDSILNKIKSTC